MKSTIIFPGQGTQHRGMGAKLFNKYPEYVQQADDILGYSIVDLCLEDKENKLNNTIYTQPALYVVNAMRWLDLKIEYSSVNFLIGHSVGEYNALLAAGVFDFVTGLQLINQRAKLMTSQPVIPGMGMSAIIGMNLQSVKYYLHNNGLNSLDIANINSPTQIVLAGPKHDLALLEQIVINHGAKAVIPLNISGAFHSRYMSQAMKIFADYLRSFSFSSIQIPVIANYNAKPYQNEHIKNNLSQHIANPVLFSDSINYLLNQGVQNFIEIGERQILSRLIYDIKTEYARTHE